ncbi:MAG: DNA recombination protein RmuC [Kangiellaceae bacterium]|jgi:DNA recombination protein RmuC|nr:DNA recombination protein RmuC [Kangiellaceae bacterium]
MSPEQLTQLIMLSGYLVGGLFSLVVFLLSRQKAFKLAEQQQLLEVKCSDLRQKILLERQSLAEAEAASQVLLGSETALKMRNSELQAKLESSEHQAAEIKRQLAIKEQHIAELNEVISDLKSTNSQLTTELKNKQEHFEQQLQQLNDNKAALTKEFENLANKIFNEKEKVFADKNKSSIESVLTPFKEQIEGFKKRVDQIHTESIKDSASLNAEIKKVLDIGLKMSDEASNLTSALKGDSQQRGAWGEAQLRRTLEMSGLIEKVHYAYQSSFKDADGRQKQTDYIIKLPDDKQIIIDSKVSLVDYDRAISAETEEQAVLLMNEHVKAVKRHIDDLASKDYTNLIGIRSPSFVLMFMPIEPAYIDALKSNKDLFNYGYDKGIVLVSHTTLIPILRTVANLWMMDKSTSEAREISQKAGDIYNAVATVAERLQKLGGSLQAASNHYNKTVTSIVGKQGLYGKVERFTELSNKVSKNLTELEPNHLDFESERLNLVAEPITLDDSSKDKTE